MKECPECNLCFDDSYNRCPQDGEDLFTSHKCSTTLSDRYVLERRLGKGGMATVFKAKHKFLKSLHAIKIISPEVVKEDETLLVRFRQEAILAASIHHQNVVNVTDFGVENEIMPFLVMEYIEGISLDEFLRTEQRLSPENALEILRPITLGVSEAHKKGITHRDLKPLNVMLKKGYPTSQGVKVLDFGLAKIKSTESFASLVQAKTTNLLGTPHYMPPEQWANEGIDSRSDIYSIGIILFQMLTGDVPFKGDSIPTIMYQHLQTDVPALASFGVFVPPQIESVIRKALAKKQDERQATAEELLGEYEDALREISAARQSKTTDSHHPPPQATGEAVAYKTDNEQVLGNTYQLPYLTPTQNQTLATYFNQPNSLAPQETQQLAQEFIHVRNKVEEARTKVSEAEKLAQEFNEAQKAAEEARQKVLQAQQKLEEDVRRRVKAEMEGKLAAEREAREKAEAQALRLQAEVATREKAEERAQELAKNALEAQMRAEAASKKAEDEAVQRQQEEGARYKAEDMALRFAAEAAEAKKRYEEAKQEAAREAHYRQQAQIQLQKFNEEIRRIEQIEADKRRLAEEKAAQIIKEQAEIYEKQAAEAQQKAHEARLLAESEVQKREQAELARIKAEEEARRLVEEIIESQKRLEQAEELAKSESEKREQEAEARVKAEEQARLSEIENKKNVEKLKKDLINQIEAAQFTSKADFENSDSLLRKISSSNLSEETLPDAAAAASISTNRLFLDTASSSAAAADTSRIVIKPRFSPTLLIGGALAIVLIGAIGGYFSYLLLSNNFARESGSESANTNSGGGGGSQQKDNLAALPERFGKKMVQVTGGTFQMGRDDVKPEQDKYGIQFPAHAVSVENFYIDRTEVTNEEYAEFIQATRKTAPENWQGDTPPAGKEKLPVTFVSNFNAREFAEWISKRDNARCQLPTEEEWEYAARGGKQQNIFPWGNVWVSNRVNLDAGVPREVGTSGDETALGGIKDMLGNVMEWTGSTFVYYPNFPEEHKDPNSKVNLFITVRGASFAATKDQIKNNHLLLTFRQGVPGDAKYPYLGFRLVCRAR